MNYPKQTAGWVGALAEARRIVHRNWPLVWIALALDAAAIAAGWAAIGFRGEPGWSIRLMLEMGLPSIGHILNRPLPANMVEFAIAAGTPTGGATFAALLALACFAQGGYIALLRTAVGGGRLSARQFARSGARAMPRFAVLAVATLFAKSALSLLLAALFGVAGLLMALLALFIFRVIHIYLEFTMYADELDFVSAMKPARRALGDTAGLTLAVAAVMYGITFGLSAAVHRCWSPVAVLAAAPVHAYAMAVLQTAFMLLFRQARDS